MKSEKILITAFLSILLIGTIVALNAYGEWENGNNSITITEGDNVDFEADVLSLDNSIVNIIMYNSTSDPIHTFPQYTIYGQTYTITPAIYGEDGTYEIVLSGDDGAGADSYTLYLTVNPVVVVNNPPSITSTPVNSVNESSAYSYQMTITDSDASDTHTYSLNQGPTWLSVDSSTGLVSGTAPSVNYNVVYNIILGVSDGTDSDTQSYSLTVLDVPIITPDTNAPNVAITAPLDGLTYGSAVTSLDYSISDAEGNLDSCWYSVDNGLTNNTMSCTAGSISLSSIEGSNTWTIYANDTYGNEDSDSVTFTVDTSGVPDTTPPQVKIMYPTEGAIYTNVTTMTYEITDLNLESCWYSINNGVINQTMNCAQGFVDILAVAGSNTWSIYARDSYGNENLTSVTFVINATFPDTTAPVITITSPENKKYRTSTIYFEVTTDEFATVLMSLDGENNITMNDGSGLKFNYTLTSVSDGSHTIVFYAEDGSGNRAIESISFSVDTSRRRGSGRDRDDPTDLLEEDPDGVIYLEQSNAQPATISLGEDHSKTQKESILITIWESIIGFFKKLFSF